MAGNIINYYIGGNTALGFHSLLENNLVGLEKLFLLKGPISEYKSEMLEKVKDIWLKAYDVEIMHAPSNNEYIEGIINRELKIGIFDSQSRHDFSKIENLIVIDYEDILEIIQEMSLTMERNRNTFYKFKETMLRDQFLVALNSHFQGKASGETFNSTGKTDILIRHENQNIFIAECKVWGGKSTFLNAIDQLIGYLMCFKLIIFGSNFFQSF